MSQTTRHTIEVEVVVDWDDACDTCDVAPHFMRVFQHGWTTEQLEALGITRPYEPQVGDVVRLTDKEAIRQDRRHFYAVSGIASGIESSQVQLWDARGTVVTWVKPSDLVFVARPEAKP